MRKVNFIFATFLTSVLVIIAGIWKFIQTDFFGEQATKILTQVVLEEAEMNLKAQNVEFQLFPPGAEIYGVKLEALDMSFRVHAEKVGVYFNLIDILSANLKVGEINIQNTSIFYDGLEKRIEKILANKNESKREDKKKNRLIAIPFQKYYDRASSLLPVNINKVILDKLTLMGNEEQWELERFKIGMKENRLHTRVELLNTDISRFNKIVRKVDTFVLDAIFEERGVSINRLQVNQGVSSIRVKGFVENNLMNPKLSLEANARFEISEVQEYYPRINKIGSLDQGVVQLQIETDGYLKDLKAKASLKATDFKTRFASGKSLEVRTELKDNKVIFTEGKLLTSSGRLSLLEPFEFFNINKVTFIDTPIKVQANKISLTNSLSYLKGILAPLKGEVSGIIEFYLYSKRKFEFKTSEAKIQNLALRPEGSENIVSKESLNVESSRFTVTGKDFDMEINVKDDGVSGKVIGKVTKNTLIFKTEQALVNLSTFGKFGPLAMGGFGAIDLKVQGRKRPVMTITADLNKVSVNDFYLDRTKGVLVYDFNAQAFRLNPFYGVVGKSNVEGSGSIFLKSKTLKVNAVQTATRILDLKKMYQPIFKNLNFISDEYYGRWRFDMDLSGGLSLEDLIVGIKMKGFSNYILGETFESASFDFGMKNKNLIFDRINFSKLEGKILGRYNYDMNSRVMDYDLRFKNFPVNNSILNKYVLLKDETVLDGQFSGNFDKDHDFEIKGDLTNKYNKAKKDVDSSFDISRRAKNIFYDLKLFNNKVKTKGQLVLDGRGLPSTSTININIPNLKNLLGNVRGIQAVGVDPASSLWFKSRFDFPGLNVERLSGELELQRLKFKMGNVIIDHRSSGEPNIILSQGKIEKWSLNAAGNKVYLSTQGKGDLSRDYNIKTLFSLDSSLFEIFENFVTQAQGNIDGEFKSYRSGDDHDYTALIFTDGLSATSPYIPTQLDKTKFNLSYKNREISIDKFESSVKSGKAQVQGTVTLDPANVGLDLTFSLDHAGVEVINGSDLIISGGGSLKGVAPPYLLSADIDIDKLNLSTQFQTDASSKISALEQEYEFMPEQAQKKAANLFDLNINLKTRNMVRLSTPQIDVGLVGEALVRGGENNLIVGGELGLAPRKNAVFFKNTEYELNKGTINFYENGSPYNPELDFQASSIVNDYRVDIQLYGPVRDFNVELSSIPQLSQEDILSLIAFGYTKDISSNLSEEQREEMTRAGVGAVIFDSFQINQKLKNEFGLSINLGTEIQEDQTNLINARASDRGGTVGRVQSATTVEVKKQISDDVNLSVSSTVGGSVGQKQSMSINLNVDKRFSVEGVYENRNTVDGQETVLDDTSIGADLKWRWSFK